MLGYGKQVNSDTFLSIARNIQLVSIDLVVRSPEGLVLLGERLDRPAQGYAFNFRKYAHRYLAEYQYRFNCRFYISG